ncbi:MAG: DUF1553 domain-containing protein, partial [Planctomycetales bacterium]
NEKKFPQTAKIFARLNKEGKELAEQAKKLKSGKLKQLETKAKKAKADAGRIQNEINQLNQQAQQAENNAKSQRDQAAKIAAENKPQADQLTKEAEKQQQAADAKRAQVAQKQKQLEPLAAIQQEYEQLKASATATERRGKMLPDVAKRLLHAEIRHLPDEKALASITSPLGTARSDRLRLLGETDALEIPADEDPRVRFVAWLKQPNNPYFAKAIVNRIWAHYFGRGIIDPPDQLSAFNPPSHPKLLDALCQKFIQGGYDLKQLHRDILNSRAYQQTGMATPANESDRENYARFYLQRLPAEVLIDALNQATGTIEKMDMKYDHWPEDMKTVEIPYVPKNAFVAYMLESFGRSKRNSAVQCDCERDSNASMLQVLSFANHPRVWEKIRDPNGRAAAIVKNYPDDSRRIEEMFLAVVGRTPIESERLACEKHLRDAASPEQGMQGILWSLLNTKEFMLNH